MSEITSETEQLESSLKATLQSLSLILAFYSSLQALSATRYAPNPPRQYTQQLRIQSAKFDAICVGIERRLVKAIAILERDARMLAGNPSAQPSPAPVSPPPAGDSFFQMDESGLGLDMGGMATVATNSSPLQADNSMELDNENSFLNDSLFGDSTAVSPEAGNNENPPLDLGTSEVVLPPPEPDLEALLAMINDFAPPPDSTDATSGGMGGFSYPGSGSTPQAIDFAALGLPDFSAMGNGSSGNMGDSLNQLGGPVSYDLGSLSAGPSTSSAPAMDFGSLDFSSGNLDAIDLDALLKSLGGS